MQKINKVYVIHHSHTDIGYTDLQERVIDTQKDYIHTVLSIMEKPEYEKFRWNCETLFCVEEFFKSASKEEKEKFCKLVSEGKLGISANYLNFTDLLDSEIYNERLGEWTEYFSNQNVEMKTAMIADINGISMGCRDAMLNHGVEFLYTNIHCHHGMYPLYQNQSAYWWESKTGKRMLVWNGEHYNLGNVLGMKPNQATNYMQETYLGAGKIPDGPIQTLHRNLTQYLNSCEDQGYKYNFLICSVSGVFSDNAPPSLEILNTIEEYNKVYGQEVEICMLSLQELYEKIKPALLNAPVYHGDLTDWWANGVGSTPYAVKHYRDARHRYHLCERLDNEVKKKYSKYWQIAQNNLMLYAEHTWGHSSTITNPYDTMVLNLDMRKNSYASKAHEAASHILNQIAKEKGDTLRYYQTNGTIKVCNIAQTNCPQLVEFYIETGLLQAAQIMDETGRTIPCQVSPHPRGRKISFMDVFQPGEEKIYTYHQIEPVTETINTRQCYIGSERVKDIVNNYDSETYHLPYYFDNKFFYLSYQPHKGILSFIDKRTGRELLGDGVAPIFTPIYEVTKVRKNDITGGCPEERERRIMGRNIRGCHAKLYIGELEEIICQERGPIFTILRFRYTLPGTIHADVEVKFFAEIPRIDFKLELGKTISSDIESIFLPLNLKFQNSSLYLKKGAEAFQPGIEQIPGTCMEFYMSDEGLAYLSPEGGAIIASHDVPLFYMGEMQHHPIQLCDGNKENNQRSVYSWVMNNIWETNFKMDLSGFCEYKYSLWLSEEQNPESAMKQLKEHTFDPYVLIVR